MLARSPSVEEKGRAQEADAVENWKNLGVT